MPTWISPHLFFFSSLLENRYQGYGKLFTMTTGWTAELSHRGRRKKKEEKKNVRRTQISSDGKRWKKTFRTKTGVNRAGKFFFCLFLCSFVCSRRQKERDRFVGNLFVRVITIATRPLTSIPVTFYLKFFKYFLFFLEMLFDCSTSKEKFQRGGDEKGGGGGRRSFSRIFLKVDIW